jgi:hypothetical protein
VLYSQAATSNKSQAQLGMVLPLPSLTRCLLCLRSLPTFWWRRDLTTASCWCLWTGRQHKWRPIHSTPLQRKWNRRFCTAHYPYRLEGSNQAGKFLNGPLSDLYSQCIVMMETLRPPDLVLTNVKGGPLQWAVRAIGNYVPWYLKELEAKGRNKGEKVDALAADWVAELNARLWWLRDRGTSKGRDAVSTLQARLLLRC